MVRAEEILQDIGFELMTSDRPPNFQLLRPRNLRLVGLSPDPGKDLLARHELVRPEIVEGDDFLAWDGYEYEEIDPASARSCLWEFIDANDFSASGTLAFVKRWGLIDSGSGADKPYWWDVGDFEERVLEARYFLLALAATEAEEVIPEELLETFAEADLQMIEEREASRRALEDAVDQGTSIADASMVSTELRRKRWREMRSTGRGVELQRTLLARYLDDYHLPGSGFLVWDDEGRRVEGIAISVVNVVWHFLYGFFMSPQIDIYVCGVCGRPYEFDEASQQRRPRSGTRSFCSEKCRIEGRRQSNRRSWQKNSQKWRPRKNPEAQHEQAG